MGKSPWLPQVGSVKSRSLYEREAGGSESKKEM